MSIDGVKELLGRAYERGTFSQKVISTFLGQTLCLVLSVASSVIIARWLGPSGKGLVGLALLVPGMMVLFLGAGIEVANVYFTASRRLDIASLAANSVGFALLATIVGFGVAVGLVTGGWLEIVVPGVPIWLYLTAMMGLPVGLLSGYFTALLRGLQRIMAVNIVNLAQGGGSLALGLLLVAGFQLGPLGAVLASIGAGAISLLAAGILLRRYGGTFVPRWDSSVMRSTLSFGLKGYVCNTLTFLNYRLDMFIVNYFVGSAGVGIYSVAVGLAELLWRLPNAVGFVLMPKAAETPAEHMNRFTPRVLRITMALTALGALSLVFLGRSLIQIIYASAFVDAYVPMLVLLPGVVLFGGAKVLTIDIGGRGHLGYNSINDGLVLIVTVVLDLILIPRYGVTGAALASSIAYMIAFILSLAFYITVTRETRGATPTVGFDSIVLSEGVDAEAKESKH